MAHFEVNWHSILLINSNNETKLSCFLHVQAI